MDGVVGPGTGSPARMTPPALSTQRHDHFESGHVPFLQTPGPRGDAEAHTTNVLIGSLGWPRDVAFVTFAYCGWLVTSQLATRWTLINWWYEMSHYDREGDQAVALD